MEMRTLRVFLLYQSNFENRKQCDNVFFPISEGGLQSSMLILICSVLHYKTKRVSTHATTEICSADLCYSGRHTQF